MRQDHSKKSDKRNIQKRHEQRRKLYHQPTRRKEKTTIRQTITVEKNIMKRNDVRICNKFHWKSQHEKHKKTWKREIKKHNVSI